ncbi:uncharacterized protein EHS24_004012 [Apiotrichum porosum]|uniref:Large ribosomal subunit protein mL49 n=1 Tax=Apiotrichum porosum TaxID=105984 RepID=A0A427Y424_9TREE|nr:uncharacterized protein EHS24_004012 [Apiotrichum porosum]RSH85832.1 hypothetical protein EHS24_004012 [Apiotrichum porosum]
MFAALASSSRTAVSRSALPLARRANSTAAEVQAAQVAAFDKVSAKAAKLPYTVERTSSGELPVYTDIKNGRTQVKTIVRKIRGSAGALKTDLQQYLADGHIDPLTPPPTVTVRPTSGHVEVKGRAVFEIKQWLEARGF